MFVCICNAVTESQVRERLAASDRVRMRDLHRDLGIATCCKHCCVPARELIREHVAARNAASGGAG
jgi:bacterioferritin-associated ferredoxin